MTETQLRDEIVRVGRSLFERGYVHATAGNISCRLDNGFLITPTDACLGFLDADRIARVDAHGSWLAGDKPSKTLALHQHIYTADPGAACVIHTHSTHLVALTLTRTTGEPELLPPITPYFVMKVGHVPLIPYHRPGSPQTGVLVEQQILQARKKGSPICAVMLDRLGPNVWSETPGGAMAILEELEETAKLWMLSRHSATPLSSDQIEELRQAFGARW
ncbi:class II aldolase/adducin family protein [Paralcaligenes ginsengisoli]|jgi:ribulose-5-phosphate 4-epimerase/fuculose-1-phosphate aldolase